MKDDGFDDWLPLLLSHTGQVYCASLVRLLRCNFLIKGRVKFSQSARLLLDRGTGSLCAGLGLKSGGSSCEVPPPNICSGADVNEWVSIVVYIYVCILPISNRLLAPQPMRKICPLWPPRQAINQTSRRFSGYFLFLSGTWVNPFLWAQTDRFHRQPREIHFNAAITQVVYCRSKWTALFLLALFLYFSLYGNNAHRKRQFILIHHILL